MNLSSHLQIFSLLSEDIHKLKLKSLYHSTEYIRFNLGCCQSLTDLFFKSRTMYLKLKVIPKTCLQAINI